MQPPATDSDVATCNEGYCEINEMKVLPKCIIKLYLTNNIALIKD